MDFWLDEALNVLRRLAALPARLDTALSRLEKGKFTITQKPTPEQARQACALTRAVNRFASSVVCVGLLGAGTALYLNGQAALGIGGWGWPRRCWPGRWRASSPQPRMARFTAKTQRAQRLTLDLSKPSLFLHVLRVLAVKELVC